MAQGNAKSDIYVGWLPKFEGASPEDIKKARELARKWLYFAFEEHGLKQVDSINPKGFAFLTFKDQESVNALLQSNGRRKMKIDWEDDTHINVLVSRTRSSEAADAASKPAHAAPTGDNPMSDHHEPKNDAHPPKGEQTDKGPDNSHGKPKDGKPKEKKGDNHSSDDHSGKNPKGRKKGWGHRLHEFGEALAGGAVTTALWEGTKFVGKELASTGVQKVGDKLIDEMTGRSPDDEFLRYIEKHLSTEEQKDLSQLLYDPQFFDANQRKRFIETAVDAIFEDVPDAKEGHPKKKISTDAATEIANKIKAALKEPLPEDQVLALGRMYSLKTDFAVGKMKQARDAVVGFIRGIDTSIASSNLPKAAADFRSHAASVRRSRRNKW